MTPAGIFSLGLSFCWAGNLRIGLMASAIHAMKLAERVGVLRRALFWAMVLAIAVSLFSSLWLVVWLAYQHGGINLDWRFYQYWGKVHAFAAYKIANPVNLIDTFDIIAPRLYYTGIGAVPTGGLIWAPIPCFWASFWARSPARHSGPWSIFWSAALATSCRFSPTIPEHSEVLWRLNAPS